MSRLARSIKKYPPIHVANALVEVGYLWYRRSKGPH